MDGAIQVSKELYKYLRMFSEVSHMQGSQLVAAWQPGCEKCRENEEMEIEWENGERFTLYISSFSF